MIKAKGIEEIINKQTQEGFLQKLKRKLSHKALTYGLAFSLLFPLARMASADTIYQKTHELEFLSPGAIYGEKQNPTTKLEVKIDCDKIAEREYEIKLSFFAQDWDKNKASILDYIFVNNTQSNFYLVYPKDTVMIGEPKESAYLLSMKHDDKKISGEWKELNPLEDSPAIKWKLNLLKGISELATTVFGGGKVMGILEEASILFEDKKEFAKNYTVSKIPFYPADKDVPARTFTIPIGIRAKAEKPELNIVLDVGLRRGLSQSEEYGRLKNLLVELPLETIKEKKKNLEEKIQKGFLIHNDKYFVISYPSSWQNFGRLSASLTTGSGEGAYFRPSPKGQIFVLSRGLHTDETLEKVVTEVKNYVLEDRYKELIDLSSVKLSDQDAYQLTFLSLGAVRSMWCYVIKDKRIYTIGYEELEDRFDDNLDAVKKMIKSFKIK